MSKEILMETWGKEEPFLPLASVNNAQRMKQPSVPPCSHLEEGRHRGWERPGQSSANTPPAARSDTGQKGQDHAAGIQNYRTLQPIRNNQGIGEELQTTGLAQKHTSVPLQYKLV